MAHSHVALDVERRRAGEAERLHVGKHLCLEHARLRPRATETGDQLVVHRAAAIATVSYHEPFINPKFSYDFGEFRRIRISVLCSDTKAETDTGFFFLWVAFGASRSDSASRASDDLWC